MEEKLSFKGYFFVGSLLFGMMFGAGNLIFPVHMGQEAERAFGTANIGFLITGIGLPFLGVIAVGYTQSSGVLDLASRIHPLYGKALTMILVLTIGPFFALPRTASVSYEIGVAPYVAAGQQTLLLAVFTVIFMGVTLFFALRPGKILIWVGKLLNPMFLSFLALLILAAILSPMGDPAAYAPQGVYAENPIVKGMTEGYNTMDGLAALAFSGIVVRTLKQLGLKTPKGIALGTMKAGIVSVVLMCVIYTSLSYMGASGLGAFAPSANGGIALAEIAGHYFGGVGAVLLALLVTVACLKTAIGLLTACSEIFAEIFPSVDYRVYTWIFGALSLAIANVGLTAIIALAVPILMLLYPLAVTLIALALGSRVTGEARIVWVTTTVLTFLAAVGDMLNALPEVARTLPLIASLLDVYRLLPLFEIGMSWILPAGIGLAIGLILHFAAGRKAA